MTLLARRGVTLAELMLVIVILGVMAGVTAMAFARRVPVAASDPRLAAIIAAREDAIRSGEPQVVRLSIDSGSWRATAYPDGRVVTDAPLGIDMLSGRRTDASR